MGVDVARLGVTSGFVNGLPAEDDRDTYTRLVAVQEAERIRIARELHDVVGQALTAVRLSLMSLGRVHAMTGASGEITDSIATIDAALHQVRTVAFDLRPPTLDDLGLTAALRSLCRHVASRAGIPIRVRAGAGEARFPQAVETACFRVAQEALTNVVRHAQATRVEVRLRTARGGRLLILEVEDDGIGFDPAQCVGSRCLGIMGMTERAALVGGDVEVVSATGAGTRIVARLVAHVGPGQRAPS